MLKIKKQLKPKKHGQIMGLKGSKPDTFTFLTNKKKTSLSWWVTWWRKRKTGLRVMINLELENGMHRVFLVLATEGGFRYKQKMFLFDDESKYYNVENNIWCYDYHESISIPIKRSIPSADIIKAIEEEGNTEVEYALNPLTIKRFAVSKIAEGIMKGQALDEFMKKLMYISVITMVSSVAMLLLFMFKTGMLEGISGGLF